MVNEKSQVESDDRLGSLLVKKGLITSQQLDQAVQCQVLFGGRLGTNLLELGFIDELELRALLEDKYRSPSVGRREMMELPAAVIALIPRKLADKFKVIPLRERDGALEVAMLEPYRESVIRHLTEAAGKKIRPVIALELDLHWALEKYYAVKREARLINLDRFLARPRPAEAESKKSRPPEPPARPPTTEPLLPDPQSITSMEGAPRNLEDFWDRVGRTGHPEYMVPRVLGDLDRADSRNEIASIVLDFAELNFARSILFVVNEDVLFGWDARGEGIDTRAALAIMLPLSRRSVFKTVVDTGAYFLGPIPDATINRRFLAALGSSRPKGILLLPVFVAGHVAAILYGDMGHEQEISIELSPLQRVLGAAGQSFQRLILKQKETNLRLEPEHP